MNLLITGAWQQAASCRQDLEQLGHQICFLQQERDALPCDPAWVEGVIGNALFLFHPIEAFTQLRYLQLTTAGLDRVPMNYTREHGILVRNARGVYSGPMAEYAVAGVLSLLKQMNSFYEAQKKHLWEKRRGLQELAGKTVVILGCGSVGGACARRFRAFDCRLIGVRRRPEEDPLYDRVLPVTQLDEALEMADILIVTIPLSPETRGLLDADRFAKLKPGAILVNIARGPVIRTDALVDALRSHLGGAVLDVFEQEPLDGESPLWDMDRVILTPHNSFVGEGNPERLNSLILKNLRKYGETSVEVKDP